MKIKHSIQNKIMLLILVGILFSSLAIGGLGIASFRLELEKSVISTMNLTCQEKAQELNNVLGRIEQSTEVMAVLALNYIESVESLKEDTYRTECVEHLTQAGYNIVDNTQGAVGIFIRLNPEIAGPKEGFYWLMNNRTGRMELEETTDIIASGKENIKSVEWYYRPIEEGKAIWIEPYENPNSQKMIVSYVMPVHKEGQLVGVVGMDIDWTYITNLVDEIRVFDTGYAFVVDENFSVIYGKEFAEKTNITDYCAELKHLKKDDLIKNSRVYELSINDKKNTAAFASLSNGKIMAAIAPNEEINADFTDLVWRIIWLALLIGLFFVVITIQIARTIIRPLKKLDKAAQDIAKGNLDVDINISSNDEVGTLAQSLSETAQQLKIKISYINSLAYSDKLTGVKNSTAYLQEVAFLKNDILQKKADFSIFIVDVNGLKYVNDNYGHETGNELIIKVTQMLVEVFGEENTYRIGGDEFAAIMCDITKDECTILQKRFESLLENQKGKIYVSASLGWARFSNKMDSTYESVFNRADEEMYDQKVRMKEDGKTSKVIE